MTGYLIYDTHLVAQGKGELPSIAYEFIANTSNIGWHYDFTSDRKRAFVFDSEVYTLDKVKEIADLWQMQVQELF